MLVGEGRGKINKCVLCQVVMVIRKVEYPVAMGSRGHRASGGLTGDITA